MRTRSIAQSERIFRPDLERLPLVLLSNDDGCVVARSAEVKALDVPDCSRRLGIGRRLSQELKSGGTRAAADLRRCDPKRTRERFSVVVDRTVSELQGVSCIAWETEPPVKKQIIASRSFGGPLYTLEQLAAPVQFRASRAAEKLRERGSAGGVWVQANIFRPQDPQYSPARSFALPDATDDTVAITACALAALRAIWRSGYRYVKAVVMLDDLRPRGLMQGSLFDTPLPEQNNWREKLLSVLDGANRKWARGTIGIGAAGVREQRGWAMRRGMLSPCYTTKWHKLRVVGP